MSINYMNDLKVEVQVPTPGLQNLIKNPDGEQGGWGWVTPIANTAIAKHNGYATSTLTFTNTVTQACRFESELLPMTAAWYAVTRLNIVAISGSHGITFRYDWYTSAKVFISSSTATAQTTGTGVKYGVATQAPANTAYMKLVVNFYGAAGANASALSAIDFNNAMVARSSTSTGFGSIRENLFPDPGVVNVATDHWEPVPGISNVDITRAVSPVFNGTTSLRLSTTNALGALVYAQSKVDIAVNAGQHYTVSTHIRSASGSRNWRIGLRYRIDGVWTTTLYSSGGAFGNSSTSWTRMSGTLLAPAGADMARIVLMSDVPLPQNEYHYFDGFMLEASTTLKSYFDGSTAAGGGTTYTWQGTANNSKSTATTASASFDYQPPYAWLPITGSVQNINIDREAMNLGNMSVTIRDETLDPAGVNKTLTPGKQVRVQARDGSTWKNVFTGKIDNANVDYKKPKTANAVVTGTITINAVDPMADLANQGESRSVATVAELPYILEGKGIPWNCNGITSHITTATVPVVNDNLNIADQVVLTRDSARAKAWIDKNGVLQVQDTLSTTPTYYLSDTGTAPAITVPNAGFEDSANIGPWTNYGGTTTTNLSNVNTQFRSGTRSLKVVAPTGNADIWIPVGQRLPVKPGQTYTASVWIKGDPANVATRPFRMNVEYFYNNTGAFNYSASTTGVDVTTTNSGWTLATYTSTVPPDTTHMGLNVYATGTTTNNQSYYFDDFAFTPVVTKSYSAIDVDWDTNRVMNQVELKHLKANLDGTAEEVVMGTYEDTTSVTTYGPRKATFTLVGTGINFVTYASNILSANATPKIRANSLTIPVKDESSLSLAANLDLCAMVNVAYAAKLGTTYRVATITHRMDLDGWFIDLTFDTAASNPAPQYTPAPPVDGGVLQDTGWITPTLVNGWTQYAGWEPVAYRRKDGIVYIRGLLNGSARTSTLMFTLPVGFRPSGSSHVVCVQANAIGTLNINTDGTVVQNTPATTTGWWSLSNICFPADA